MQPKSIVTILQEREEDFAEIRKLVKASFASAEHSDGDEHNLIDRIRNSAEYIPELALTAVSDGCPVGYIMFSSITIGQVEAIALAPLAVKNEMQRKGIGKLLIEHGHAIARKLGYPCSIVLGYPDYYSQFGYLRASDFNIIPPFEVPDEYFMACPFDNSGKIPQGIVRYPKAFGL